MKKMIFILAAISFAGCQKCPDRGCNSETAPNNSDIRFAPEGAELIKDYGNLWTKWKFEDECFLSYNLQGSTGLLTKVSCPEDVN